MQSSLIWSIWPYLFLLEHLPNISCLSSLTKKMHYTRELFEWQHDLNTSHLNHVMTDFPLWPQKGFDKSLEVSKSIAKCKVYSFHAIIYFQHFSLSCLWQPNCNALPFTDSVTQSFNSFSAPCIYTFPGFLVQLNLAV